MKSEYDDRLIAAAPAMLKALQNVRDLLPMCSCDNGVHSPSGQSEGEHWLALLQEEVNAVLMEATGQPDK